MFDKDNDGTIDVYEFIKMFYKNGVDSDTW